VASLILLIAVNIASATTPTFGVTSNSKGENNHYVHKSCEHAGGSTNIYLKATILAYSLIIINKT
jgi:hypothetical protein